MPITAVATGCTCPVPDQLCIAYELRDGVKVVDTGRVQLTLPPSDLTKTPAERARVIRDIFARAVRPRIHAMKAVAAGDSEAVQNLVKSGRLVVGEAD